MMESNGNLHISAHRNKRNFLKSKTYVEQSFRKKKEVKEHTFN